MAFITNALAILSGLVAYYIYRIVQNLFVSPLKDVPGDKLAAASTLYEFYWDCLRPGLYWKQIERMHAQYGPIVRIGPNEVHVQDPDYYDVLYNNRLRLDKDPFFYGILGLDDTAFTSVTDAVHRQRRGNTNAFFSKANVDRGEAARQRILENMFAVFDKKMAAGEPIALRYASRSFASDVVCEYCFPKSPDYSAKDDFSALFHKGQEGFGYMLPWFRHVPGLAKLMMSMPDAATPYMPPDMQAAQNFLKYIEHEVADVTAGKDLGPDGRPTQRTIIREILDSKMPADMKSIWCLLQEGQSYVAAGTQTTGRAIEEGIYWIMSQPEVHRKLVEEVRGVGGSTSENVSGKVLEQLPYLSAVVLEALRIVPAVVSRFPRVNKTDVMKYDTYSLPPGTVVSMSAYEVLIDGKVFEDPMEFRPERWLDPERKNKLMKYLVAFGKGSRNCIGQNLATTELYLVFGNLFRRYDLELYDSSIKDVTIIRDNFVPFHDPSTKGVRVMLSKPKRA